MVEPAPPDSDQEVILSIVVPEPKPAPVPVGGPKEDDEPEAVDDTGALDTPPVPPADADEDARAAPAAALEDAFERRLAGGVGAVARGQDGHGEALVAAGEQRDLVVDGARARAPAALEVDAPVGQVEPPDAPALGGDDLAQQPQAVRAVARRQQRVDAQEEAGLVARGDLREAPDRRGGAEAGHARGAREPVEAARGRRGRRSPRPRRRRTSGPSAPAAGARRRAAGGRGRSRV